MSDYLLDKSGEPDVEIQQLETLLAPLGHRGRSWKLRRRNLTISFGVAASILAALGVTWFAYRPARPSWQVSTLAGKPSVTRLGQGQSLQTDAVSRAKLELDGTGEIEVDPNTQLTVVAIRPEE